MSDLLQSRNYSSGEHPDADQLNAFIEQALSEHERMKTLAHLADCAACREIVVLSLPPLEDAATAEPVIITPSRSTQRRFSTRLAGFFSGWNLAWIAAPALAALVILTIHFRNPSANQHKVTAPEQMADSHPPTQPGPPPLAAKPDMAPAPLAQKAAPAKPSANAEKSKAAGGPANAPATGAANGASSAPAPAIDGRDVAALKLPPPVISQGRVAQFKAAPSKAGQSIGGPVLLQRHTAGEARSVDSGVPSAPRPSGTALGFLRPPSQTAGSSPVASAPAPGQYAPAQPLPPTVLNYAPVSSANSATVSVNAQNSQMDLAVNGRETTSIAQLAAAPKSRYVPAQAPLPSGLAVLSLAANLHQRLALDTRHQLFVSEDDGQHWKAVSVPWQARAIRVATIAVGPTVSDGAAFAVPERYTPGATASAQPGGVLGEGGGILSGAVTDATGAAIPGATVVATDNHTALTRSVQTDGAGRYLVDELPPGDYRLVVRATGFLKQSQIAVLSPPQQTVTNIVLAVGQSSQTVEVQSSQIEQLQTFSRANSLASAKARKPAASPTVNKQSNRPPVFVITTDVGDRWTSSDGQIWTQAAK